MEDTMYQTITNSQLKEFMEAQCSHPPCNPRHVLKEKVTSAMRRPEVEAARGAFLDFVAEVTSNKVIPTNYYDTVLGIAIGSLEEPTCWKTMDTYSYSYKMIRLIDLYLAFVDAIVPYQPDAGETDEDDISDKVFYFIEGSGGYWISRGNYYRNAFKKTKIAMNDSIAKKARNEDKLD